jgi:hypothetical protein
VLNGSGVQHWDIGGLCEQDIAALDTQKEFIDKLREY